MAYAKYKTQGGADKYAAEIRAKFPGMRAESWHVWHGEAKPWGVRVVEVPGRWALAPARDKDGPRIKE